MGEGASGEEEEDQEDHQEEGEEEESGGVSGFKQRTNSDAAGVLLRLVVDCAWLRAPGGGGGALAGARAAASLDPLALLLYGAAAGVPLPRGAALPRDPHGAAACAACAAGLGGLVRVARRGSARLAAALDEVCAALEARGPPPEAGPTAPEAGPTASGGPVTRQAVLDRALLLLAAPAGAAHAPLPCALPAAVSSPPPVLSGHAASLTPY